MFYAYVSDLTCGCSFFFFFSSRRRHTRSLCDWSSDVCSSDLLRETVALPQDAQEGPVAERHAVLREAPLQRAHEAAPRLLGQVRKPVWFLNEIGRASCRERV